MSENVAFAIPNSYMCEYVTNIPWEKNPAFALSNDADGYLTAFRNIIEVIPIGDMKIHFEDDLWDFRPYFKHINNASYVLHFENCPNEIKDCMKFFVLFLISDNSKISTANVRLKDCLFVINSIMKKTNHKTIFSITYEQVIDVVYNGSRTAQTRYNLLYAVYRFFKFIESNYHYNIALNITEVKRIMEKNAAIRTNDIEENKLSDIPEKYFQDIRNMSIRIMHDESAEYNNRATAALIVILTDTGLRVSDLTTLNIYSLKTKTLSKSKHTVNFIHYLSQKSSPAHGKKLEFDIFCTSECSEAFQTLLNIRKKCAFSRTTDYLYVLDSTTNSDDRLPINSNRFVRIYRNLIETYLPEDCAHSWDGSIEPSKGNLHETVYIPKTEQFRVHICSFLYNEKHLPLVWIQRYMGHLSEAMLGYYVRPKDTYQEDIKRFGEVIKEIHDDHIKPLGGDGKGSEIAKRINSFIDSQHLNAVTDVKEIADAIEDRVIIRAKTGGVCIKTSLMPCSRDSRTDEIMCAYDLCPNLFHFYYMADVSYENFTIMKQTITANRDRGHVREAQKELNKLHNYLSRRLIPELDELDAEIVKNGVELIIKRYPNLIDIISKEDAIREEIKIWQNMKIHA